MMAILCNAPTPIPMFCWRQVCVGLKTAFLLRLTLSLLACSLSNVNRVHCISDPGNLRRDSVANFGCFYAAHLEFNIFCVWYQVSRESHKQMKDEAPADNGYVQIRRQITPLNPIRVQHRRSPAAALAQFNDPVARNADEERAKTNIKSP